MIVKNKNETFQNYLAKLSPQGNNEYSVWKATKHLKRLRSEVNLDELIPCVYYIYLYFFLI